MREILFRGKTEKGKWVYGSPLFGGTNNEVAYITKIFEFEQMVIPETVGQFTGLTDKNGNKVFEGDIVRILYDWTSQSENDTRTLDEYLRDIAKIGVVEWDRDYPQFHIHFMDKDKFNSLDYGRYGYIEVIGNIYDNPELLGE